MKSSFQSSDYSSWRVDDVDYIERADMADLYVLDVESGELDADLHYSADGILVKVIGDLADGSGNTGNTGGGTGDLIPSQPSSAIEEYIQTKYPNARIIEIDREDRGYTEVDIINEGVLLELLFDEGGAWVQTSQDVRVRELPQAVTSAIQAAYPGYQIDDADWVETPEGEWYLVELEMRGEADLYVRVTEDGTIL